MICHTIIGTKTPSFQDPATWVNLEDITLSEISQTQKDKYCLISLIGGISKSQIHRSREMNAGYQGRGGGEYGEMLVKGHKATVL